MAIKKSNGRCKTHTKAGKHCRAAATDSGLCFFHANPNKAVELGRIGGRKNGHAHSATTTPLPALQTAGALQEAVARLIEDLYSGKLQPRLASGLASLLNLQLKVLETSSIERRVAQLEKLLTECQEASASSEIADPPGKSPSDP